MRPCKLTVFWKRAVYRQQVVTSTSWHDSTHNYSETKSSTGQLEEVRDTNGLRSSSQSRTPRSGTRH